MLFKIFMLFYGIWQALSSKKKNNMKYEEKFHYTCSIVLQFY